MPCHARGVSAAAEKVGERAFAESERQHYGGSISEIGNGAYVLDAAAGDLNGDLMLFKFVASGADQAHAIVKTAA